MQLKSEVHKTDPALIRRGIVWLLLLAPLFYATYGLANWLASQRVAVPEIVFDWEKQIPFWGWTIIPYWSLNLFYAVAVLASISKQAQDRLVGRYLTAQCIAFVCFIAFPLTITWEKPVTTGLSGWLFAMLGNFDQPFNQAPSLHIALAIIIWDHLRDRLPVFWRMIWHGWCLLIALSVLTTWQHHFIDIPAGALLGLFALWLFPHEGVAPWQDYRLTCDRKALQLAAIYGGAGLLLFALTFTAQHPAILLVLWPALALLLLGLAYSGGGTKFFQKRRDGSVSLASFWLFLPLRVFFRLNRIAWTWREPPAVKITEGLYLGRFPKHSETQNYARIIDMTAECIAPRNSRSRWQAFPLMDLAKPDLATLHAATTAIHDAPRPTLICCALGYQRSANLIARWLVESGEVADRQKAEELIRQTGRPVRLYPDHQ
ncbi:MAG: phosphatase PAP2/dual specificity phosphatase family protein [Brucellaceae bacterium]|jgi:protein-tyrosine phosphatase|nr:phosphatase PAP2/dual specificity phosphatase family protein [Brucellaceae bacterium]